MKNVILSLSCLLGLLYSGCMTTSDLEDSGVAPDTLYETGLGWLRNKKPERAETVFRKLLSIKPDYTDAYIQLGYTYYSLYEQYLTSSEYQKEAPKLYNQSYNCFKEGIKRKPEDPQSYAGLGRLEFTARRFEEAVKYLLNARKFTMPYELDMEAVICYDLGRCYLELGRYKEAIEELQGYLEVVPTGNAHDSVKAAIAKIEKMMQESTPKKP